VGVEGVDALRVGLGCMVESGLVYFMSWWCVKSSLVVIWTRGRAREDDSLRPKDSRLRPAKGSEAAGNPHFTLPHPTQLEMRPAFCLLVRFA
jgi:hypothetical protein